MQKNPRGWLLRSLAALRLSSVRLERGCSRTLNPTTLRMRTFLRAASPGMPRTKGVPMASSGLESGQRPTPTDAAPPGGRSRECSQHPWPLIPPYLPSHASTSPQAIRGRVPSRGWQDTRGRPGPISQVSGFPRAARLPDCSPPAPRKHTGVIPVTTEGKGRDAAIAATYLCPSSKTTAPATRPRSRASALEQNKPL